MHHWIQKLACILLSAVVLAVSARADILANGDFSQGTVLWKGDAHGDGPGVVVNLDPMNWTKIYQAFDTSESALQVTVTYSLSDDCSLAPNAPQASAPVLDQLVFQQITNERWKRFKHTFKPTMWMASVVDPMGLHAEWVEFTNRSPDNPKTVTGILKGLVAHEEKTLYLIFPPGTGSVTLASVSLSPLGTNAP